MANFCSNCGKKLNEGQDVCLDCGTFQKREEIVTKPAQTKGNNTAFNISMGCISILIGIGLLFAYFITEENIAEPSLTYGFPGTCLLISGIFQLLAINKKGNMIPAAIFIIVGAIFNFIGKGDLSMASIYAMIVGIFNFVVFVQKD